MSEITNMKTTMRNTNVVTWQAHPERLFGEEFEALSPKTTPNKSHYTVDEQV